MSVLAALMPRLLLVLLFLPFSAWDKIVARRAAVAQARQIGIGPGLGAALIAAGLLLEVVGSLAVLSGVADRLAALLLALYCAATALLYKRFWALPGGVFHPHDDTRRREMFFDFWKNLAVAGGFLLLALGQDGSGLEALLAAPLSSTDPYGG